MTDIIVSTDRQKFILDTLRAGWENTYTRDGYVAKIGKTIGDQVMVKQAVASMEKALQAIAVIDAELTKLEGGDKSG